MTEDAHPGPSRVMVVNMADDAERVVAAFRNEGTESLSSWVVGNRRRARLVRPLVPAGCRVVCLSDFADEGALRVTGSVLEELRYFWFELEGLAARNGYRSAYNFDDSALVLVHLKRAWALVQKMIPERAIFLETPHSIRSYAVYLALREFGVPISFMRRGPAPHQVMVSTDITKLDSIVAPPVGLLDAEEVSRLNRFSRAYVEKLSSDAGSEPSFMTEQRDRNRGLRTLLPARKSFSHPRDTLRLTVRSVRRRVARGEYQALCDTVDWSRPSICYFLHFQPERTTQPDGGMFANQALAIAALVGTFGADYDIVVREHPLTFLLDSAPVRSTSFYRYLKELGVHKFVDLDLEVSEIIRRSSAVATVNGTVGMQALAAGTPVVYFGTPPYRDFAGAVNGMADSLSGSLLSEVASEISASPSEHLSRLIQSVQMFDHKCLAPLGQGQDPARATDLAEALPMFLRMGRQLGWLS